MGQFLSLLTKLTTLKQKIRIKQADQRASNFLREEITHHHLGLEEICPLFITLLFVAKLYCFTSHGRSNTVYLKTTFQHENKTVRSLQLLSWLERFRFLKEGVNTKN